MTELTVQPLPQVVFRVDRKGLVLDYEAALAGPLAEFMNIRRRQAVHRCLHAECTHAACKLLRAIESALANVERARILEWEHEDPSGWQTLRLHLRRAHRRARTWATLTVTDISEARRLARRLAATNKAFADVATAVKGRSLQVVSGLDRKLKDLSSELIVAQHDERRRIARDLHDGLGQWLSMAKLSLETGLQRIGAAPAKGDLMLAFRHIETAISEVRTIAASMQPSMLQQFGLGATLELLCHELRLSQPQLKLEFRIEGRSAGVPTERGVAMIRILQEALTNIVRHSKATAVLVEVRLSRNDASLRVFDNGIGLKARGSDTTVHHGVGLANMRERAAQCGGALRVASIDSGGTEVVVEWPAPANVAVRARRGRSRSRKR